MVQIRIEFYQEKNEAIGSRLFGTGNFDHGTEIAMKSLWIQIPLDSQQFLWIVNIKSLWRVNVNARPEGPRAYGGRGPVPSHI